MEMELPILTEKNYYDDVFYMSNSRFKEYIACPLRQQAIDLGFWKGKKSTDALLLGNYVHSYFESEEAHAELIREVFLDGATPDGCGHCDFCLTHKKLETAITLDELLEK